MKTDVETGLLAEVCRNPDDDGPRLVLADWLSENGQDERSEFIRVQVELAIPSRPGHEPYFLHLHHNPCRCNGCALNRRERELRDRLLTRQIVHLDLSKGWSWDCGQFGVALTAGYSAPDRPIYKLFPPGGGPEVGNVEFRRGFVERVTIDLATFCGGVCSRCNGWKRVDPPCDTCDGTGRVEDPDNEDGYVDGTIDCPDCDPVDCPACAGKGRTSGVAGALFGAAPVVEVTLSDKEPYCHTSPVSSWYCQGRVRSNGFHPQSDLPPALFDLLEGGRRYSLDNGVWYDASEAARAALSDASVRFGRAASGLPDLATTKEVASR